MLEKVIRVLNERLDDLENACKNYDNKEIDLEKYNIVRFEVLGCIRMAKEIDAISMSEFKKLISVAYDSLIINKSLRNYRLEG